MQDASVMDIFTMEQDSAGIKGLPLGVGPGVMLDQGALART